MNRVDSVRLERAESEAEGYLELEMPEQALAALDRVRHLVPRSANALFLLGETLRSLQRYAEAIEPIREAARQMPKNIYVRLAIGWCCKRTDRLPEAVAAMEEALENEPSEAILHYNLSCYLSLAGEKTRALFHLAQALSLDAGFRNLIPDEADFDPIRSDPAFVALLQLHDR